MIKQWLRIILAVALLAGGFKLMLLAWTLPTQALGKWYYWLAFMAVPASMISYVVLAAIATVLLGKSRP